MYQNKDVVAKECRFVVHCVDKNNPGNDLHLIKEAVITSDGKSHPNLSMVENYERSYWLVKKGLRTYTDQKEWIDVNSLDEFRSRQCELDESVFKSLDKGWMKDKRLRKLKENIYVFGTDILSTCLIKRAYHARHPQLTSFTNAAGDTETDMIYGHGQIMMATISFKERVFTVIQASFVKGYANPEQRIKELADLYIGDDIKNRNIVLDIVIVPDEISVVKAFINKAHEWKPDFFSFWNITFDMNKIIEACKRADVDPADLFSDPIVPPRYRHFTFKEGPARKTTASGVIISYKNAQRWHTVFTPASFYLVDAMCAYRQIRQGRPEEKSYSLDARLNAHLERGKLKFKEADHLKAGSADWHRFMQLKYPLEYTVYNIFDCIGMELLDEKTRDLELSMPSMSKFSDFQHFNSQPRKAMNDLHFYLLEKKGHVAAMTSGDMATDFDLETLGSSEWIIMLAQERVADNGLKCIMENPNMVTNIRAHNGD